MTSTDITINIALFGTEDKIPVNVSPTLNINDFRKIVAEKTQQTDDLFR